MDDGHDRIMHCDEVTQRHRNVAEAVAGILPEGYSAVIFSERSPRHGVAILGHDRDAGEEGVMGMMSALCCSIIVQAHSSEWVRTVIANTVGEDAIRDAEGHDAGLH